MTHSLKITFVKKILASGEPCPKCNDVQQKLEDNDQMRFIDETLIADERDDNSPGMQLAKQYQVTLAPFFIVETPDQPPKIYTVYLKFAREILGSISHLTEENAETLRQNPDLDFL